MRIALFSLLAVLTTPSMAQIYSYTDDRGNTVFTNQPPEGAAADTVELPPTNTVNIKTPDLPPPLAAEQNNQPEGNQQPYRSLSIGGIPDDQAMRANNGTFIVNAQLDPPLQQGHQIRFMLDGSPLAAPSRTTSLQLDNVDRGTHSLAIEVLSGGQVIQGTERQFTVQRVHTSSPARR